MKIETYLIAVFIWKYKNLLENENEFTLDESYDIAQEIVKSYLGSDEYIPQDNAEVDEFLYYVEKNLTDFIS